MQKCILIIKMHEIWSVDSQEIIELLVTRCQILNLKCTKFDLTPSWIQGGLLLREGRKGEVRERKGDGEGNLPPLKFRSGYATAHTCNNFCCFVSLHEHTEMVVYVHTSQLSKVRTADRAGSCESSHRYRKLHAIWDHTVLPATWQW